VLSRPADVAKRLGLSRVAVYKAIRAGRFAAVQVFCGSGPLRVFTDANGSPRSAAPKPAGKKEFVEPIFLARRLRVSPTLVRSACAAGLMDARQTPGGQWRILVDSGTWLPFPPREPRKAGLQNERIVPRTTENARSREKRNPS